jgi:hypothetical protein
MATTYNTMHTATGVKFFTAQALGVSLMSAINESLKDRLKKGCKRKIDLWQVLLSFFCAIGDFVKSLTF